MPRRLMPHVLEAEVKLASEERASVTFSTDVDRLLEYLESLPNSYSFELSSLEGRISKQPTPRTEREEWVYGCANLRESSALLRALAYGSAYIVLWGITDLVEAMNRRSCLLAIQCTRSLIEHVAYQNEVYLSSQRVIEGAPDLKSGDLYLRSLEFSIALVKLWGARRFNTEALSEPTPERILHASRVFDEDFKATNTLTLIERLPPDGQSWRVAYELLSEYVHPNLGTRVMCFRQTVDPESGGEGPWVVSSELGMTDQLSHTIAVLSGPVQALGTATTIITNGMLRMADLFERLGEKFGRSTE